MPIYQYHARITAPRVACFFILLLQEFGEFACRRGMCSWEVFCLGDIY